MKKPLLILFLILMTADISLISGQPNRYNYKRLQSKLGFGVKAGVNLASQTSSGSGLNIDVKSIVRVNAGGYCNYFLTRYFGVQGEILISGKGAHWEDYYDDMKDLITYFDVPLLVKYQPAQFVNVHAGVQAAFRIRATQKDMETGIRTSINDYYSFSEYGLVGGIEANLPNKINLTLRYIYGITPATTDVKYINPWRNNIIQFSAGYRFSGR